MLSEELLTEIFGGSLYKLVRKEDYNIMSTLVLREFLYSL